jgi:hypothetical protein
LARRTTTAYRKIDGGKHLNREFAPGTSLPTRISDEVKSGTALVGDDYPVELLDQWFEQEKEAFYSGDQGNSDVDPWYSYMRYVNERLGFAHLGRPGRMLVIGPGSGIEVATLREWSLTFLEASDNFKSVLQRDFPGSSVIHPRPDGQLALPDRSQDAVCAFSVLHHIPNVSAVIAEVARVTASAGIFLVREPCSSMGDWRSKRSATPNERGIAAAYMIRVASEQGFRLRSATPILFEPINKILKKTIGYRLVKPKALFLADRAISALLAGNDHYWRDTALKRLAPSSYFFVFQKD